MPQSMRPPIIASRSRADRVPFRLARFSQASCSCHVFAHRVAQIALKVQWRVRHRAPHPRTHPASWENARPIMPVSPDRRRSPERDCTFQAICDASQPRRKRNDAPPPEKPGNRSRTPRATPSGTGLGVGSLGRRSRRGTRGILRLRRFAPPLRMTARRLPLRFLLDNRRFTPPLRMTAPTKRRARAAAGRTATDSQVERNAGEVSRCPGEAGKQTRRSFVESARSAAVPQIGVKGRGSVLHARDEPLERQDAVPRRFAASSRSAGRQASGTSKAQWQDSRCGRRTRASWKAPPSAGSRAAPR